MIGGNSMTSKTLKYHSSLLLLFFVFASTGFWSCNNNDDCDPDFPVVCDFYDPPLFAPLNILVTVNDDNPYVPIEIYLGDVEDGNLYLVDTLDDDARYEVDIDERYSAMATYQSLGRTIIAIDGDRVKSKSTDNCGVTCWEAKSGTINLRLKN